MRNSFHTWILFLTLTNVPHFGHVGLQGKKTRYLIIYLVCGDEGWKKCILPPPQTLRQLYTFASWAAVYGNCVYTYISRAMSVCSVTPFQSFLSVTTRKALLIPSEKLEHIIPFMPVLSSSIWQTLTFPLWFRWNL